MSETIYIKTDFVPADCDYLTVGKVYKADKVRTTLYNIINDKGSMNSILLKGCAHLDYKDWAIVVKTKYTQEFTTIVLRTFEEATRLANLYTKGLAQSGKEAGWLPEYNTTIKVDGIDSDECWVITNRFDPDIRKANEVTA